MALPSSGKKLPSFFSFLNVETAFLVVSIIYVLYVLHYAATLYDVRSKIGIPFLSLSIIVLALGSIRGRSRIFGLKGKANTAVAIAFIILSALVAIYYWVSYFDLVYYRSGASNLYDIIFGAIAVVLVIETTRKDTELWIVIVTLGFLVYGFFGPYFPGILRHPGFSLWRLVEISSSEIFRGIYGLLNEIAATWIAIFAVFGGLIYGFGGLDAILKFSRIMARRSMHGVPQSAVVASWIFGMFSSSAPGNVAATGPITIPMMKRMGMPAKFAGAAVSVAGSGGQISPPIMGAGAFLMTSFLGTTYLHIIQIGLPPSILFYASVMFSVFFLSRQYIRGDVTRTTQPSTPKRETQGTAVEEEKLTSIVLDLIPIGIAVAVLLILMAYLLLDILVAGFYTNVTYLASVFILMALRIFRKAGLPSFLREYARSLAKSVINAAESLAPIAAMLGCIGIIVSVFSVSGLAIKVSMSMYYAAGGSLLLLSVFVAIAAIVFGMGVSTTACYLLAVTIAVPAFLKMGIDPYIVHFYVFYFAVLSAITPPVAIASVVGARISGASYLEVCVEACKMSLPLFILPATFVLYPETILFSAQTPITYLVLLIAFIGMNAGMYGAGILSGVKGYVLRAVLLALSFGTIILPLFVGWILAYTCSVITVLAVVVPLLAPRYLSRPIR